MTEPNSNPKLVPLTDLQKDGIIQEINRRFLHPLGMAISYVTDGPDEGLLGELWDYRDDPEGMAFVITDDNITEMLGKAQAFQEMVNEIQANNSEGRLNLFGSLVQPISIYPRKSNGEETKE